MSNKTLHMMVGLPRSGKSTKSKELGFPIVEPDAIRKTLCCFPFEPSLEPLVGTIADLMVNSLFNAGHNDVILDETNHNKQRRALWENELWAIKHHLVDTPPEVCVERAVACGQDYLVPVIHGMWAEWEDCSNE